MGNNVVVFFQYHLSSTTMSAPSPKPIDMSCLPIQTSPSTVVLANNGALVSPKQPATITTSKLLPNHTETKHQLSKHTRNPSDTTSTSIYHTHGPWILVHYPKKKKNTHQNLSLFSLNNLNFLIGLIQNQ